MASNRSNEVIILILLTLLLITFYKNGSLPQVAQTAFPKMKHYNKTMSRSGQPLVTNVPESKTILLFKNNWSFRDGVILEGCTAKCIITKNSNRHLEADMIIFYSDDLTSVNMEDVSRHRPDSQLWVFNAMESPIRTYRGKLWDAIRNVSGLFNVTMSYSTEADIFTPYGYTVKKRGKILMPSIYRKGVVWFVSHYVEFRINYVLELKKYLQVDIFGDCGEKDKCGRKNSKCIQTQKRKYMFYLAFENSLCEDYLTEKFWNALKDGLIPVVMGARIESYKQLAPPNSFIHIDNYKSPKELSEYLKFVQSNRKAYYAYHQWRNMYSIISINHLCAACKFAHTFHGQRRIIPDVASFWSKEKYCIDPSYHNKLKTFLNVHDMFLSNRTQNLQRGKICFNPKGNINSFNDQNDKIKFSFLN